MKSKDRKRFSHRIDMWDDDGENVLEHLAGVEDFDLAMAAYRAACLRWPGAAITIRLGRPLCTEKLVAHREHRFG